LPLPRTAISKPCEEGVAATGSWRTYRPIINQRECAKCLSCWLYCPEGAIQLTKKGYPRIDLKYCKGCGICAEECPKKTIKMRFEGEMKINEKNRDDR
jgi:2-oxoacid:acceptor oxidoreductase delta subunit (pyruvate/2-ketoisovalerate family)